MEERPNYPVTPKAPMVKHRKREPFLVILGLAACVLGVAVAALVVSNHSLNESQSRLHATQRQLTVANDDALAAQTAKSSAEQHVATCQDAVDQMARMIVFEAKAAKQYVNATQASIFEKVVYLAKGNEYLSKAHSILGDTHDKSTACQSGEGGTGA